MKEGEIDHSRVKSKCPMVDRLVSYGIDLKVFKNYESWDKIKFEQYTLSTFIWNRVWKIDEKWKKVRLTIVESSQNALW